MKHRSAEWANSSRLRLCSCRAPFSYSTVRRRVPIARRPVRQWTHENLKRNAYGIGGQVVKCLAEAQRGAAFPAGKRQAKVQLPACFISVEASDVQQQSQALSAAVSAGATGILLLDERGAGGAEIYEAGVQLKELIRGRAVLLISNRTDIVDAVGADGVALTEKGVPTLVARRMLRENDELVARVVTSAQEAKTAAAEGANLVILQGSGGSVPGELVSASKTQQGSSGGIPVVASIGSSTEASTAARSGADGSLLQVQSLSRDAADQVRTALKAFSSQVGIDEAVTAPSRVEPEKPASKELKHFLDAPKEALLEEEREFLSKSLGFLQEAAPEMEELGLLKDAMKQLDELFLLVVCGEFNSGKSSIINALLGDKYLAEGILPTTNEISVLKYSDTGEEVSIQDADGYYIRKLSAELLRELNIVDTPGTNVIVDRQQRLTEEYVPRADLVLFCMSADRPFTESETNFLKYIRQWGKKVVFIVNKVDLLSNEQEIGEVTQFVSNSATRLLGVERTQVLAVSARTALEAKMSIGGGRMAGSILSSEDEAALAGDPKWESSRFGVLERFILDFLIGGASAGERVRLKLQTPLFVTDALLEAASRQLTEDLAAAQEDVRAVKSVQNQLESFRKDMARDGQAQRSECRKLVAGAIKRAQNLVDSTLQLSNIDALSGYIFGSRADAGRLPVASAFQQEVVGPSAGQLEELVDEHRSWLTLNCNRQLSNYRKFAEARAEQLGTSLSQLTNGKESTSDSLSTAEDSAAEERRQWRESRVAAQETSPSTEAGDSEAAPQTSLAVVKAFNPGAGALVLEEEIRESVINTAGAALGAAVLGVVFTFVLPNTLEDLFALAIGGLVGYAALLNLPLRRADAKDKLQKAATSFIEDLDQKMEDELMAALDSCVEDVNTFILPLQQRCEAMVAQIEGYQEQQANITNELRSLQQKAANIE